MGFSRFNEKKQKGQAAPNLMGKCAYLMLEIKRANPGVHERLREEYEGLRPENSEDFCQRLMGELKQLHDNKNKDVGAVQSQAFVAPENLQPIVKHETGDDATSADKPKVTKRPAATKTKAEKIAKKKVIKAKAPVKKATPTKTKTLKKVEKKAEKKVAKKTVKKSVTKK